MERCNFSRDERLRILKGARENGIKVTLRKHGLTYGYYWKRKYDEMGDEGLADEQYKFILPEELLLFYSSS